MSDLSLIEKNKLERLFGMSSGYVLDFSNRTLQGFVADSVARNIYDQKYNYESGSKANRLRAFWNVEPNHRVGKLIDDLLEYWLTVFGDEAQERLFEDCKRIAARLRQGAPVEEIEALTADQGDRTFELLASDVRRNIEDNTPDAGLDRLHTFVTRLIREWAEARGVTITRDKPLHGIFGEYVKKLRDAELIESEMTERILKSSISILEAFNQVRNDKSLAHDNPTLNYEESLLIFNHVCSAVRFVRSIEANSTNSGDNECAPEEDDDELPF